MRAKFIWRYKETNVSVKMLCIYNISDEYIWEVILKDMS